MLSMTRYAFEIKELQCIYTSIELTTRMTQILTYYEKACLFIKWQGFEKYVNFGS